MLSENDDVISFYPGTVKNGNVELGRIVVHDRLKVEAHVLPRYFNHSSFASLRRQLNYFSFTRMGKGRQRGATYCNEGVVELEDILRLKRRSSVGGGNNGTRESPSVSQPPPVSSSQSVIHASVDYSGSDHDDKFMMKRARYNGNTAKHTTPTAIVSPRSSPVHQGSSDCEQHITLDLTVPSATVHHDPKYTENYKKGWSALYSSKVPHGDEDILAGCNALLSFSKGFTHRSTTV